MLVGTNLPKSEVEVMPLRLLAHVGDAVFHLFERERQVLKTVSARDLHLKTVSRVKATQQSKILDLIHDRLSDKEQSIVRRARNLKPSGNRKADQHSYRQSTAFEALIGYLYLTDLIRLKEILECTVSLDCPPNP